MTYKIARPPSNMPSFGMPSKADLEGIEKETKIKAIFVMTDSTERMWVNVSKITSDGTIEGVLDSTPLSSEMALGQKVTLHVTDVIQVFEIRNIEFDEPTVFERVD